MAELLTAGSIEQGATLIDNMADRRGIPERELDFERDVVEKIRRARLAGTTHYMVVVAEGAGNTMEISQQIRDEIGQIPRMAAHDLHHGAAFMGLHGIPQLVNALDGGVAGGVKTDGIKRTSNVVVCVPPAPVTAPSADGIVDTGNHGEKYYDTGGHYFV